MTDPAESPESEARMRLRTQLLLEVLNGKITGVQAAKRLGVSRKTWCEWQARGLEALRDRATAMAREDATALVEGFGRMGERRFTLVA